MSVYIDSVKCLILREKQNKGMLLTDHLYKHIGDVSNSLYVISKGKNHLAKSVYELEILGYIKSVD